MQNLSISIPKPCHEDWNKMNDEERGRFCSKCSKTVFDFSDKTYNEVQQFVSAHQNEKLCGRFRNDQLSQTIAIQIPAPEIYRKLSPLQMFAVIALLIFGTSLFSCTSPQGHTLGVMVPDISNLEKNTWINEDQPEQKDTAAVIISKQHGQMAKENTEVHAMIKGKVEVEPDTLFETLPYVDIESSKETLVCSMTTGLMMVQTEAADTHENFDMYSSSTDKNKEDGMQGSADDFNIRIYPNPGDGFLNLEINLENEDFVQADLYDNAGRYVSNLLAKQIMQPGKSSFQLNISNHPPGIYLLKTAAGNKIRTEKAVLEKR